MRRAVLHHGAAVLAGLLAIVAASQGAIAGGIEVLVLDRDGQPVPEVAVYARASGSSGSAAAEAGAPSVSGPELVATMNQHELAFDPHILVVETGTLIDFPNEDQVRHHVYSFSPVKRFNFSVDSGSIHEALRFDEAGVVTLGCNIHDDMLAYIVVVDTPHFTMTNGDGIAELPELAPGRYELEIWTPRVASKHLPDAVVVDVQADRNVGHEFRFDANLYRAHRHSETSLVWSDY